jgi:DNA polymerase-3 subunit gamma/tau
MEPLQQVKGEAVPNGSSSIVRKPSISIKGSLQATRQPPSGNDRSAEPVQEPEDPGRIEPLVPDPDRILDAWKTFASSVEKSRPRMYSTLVNNKPVIKPDGTVLLLLNSEAQRENFVKNIKPLLTAHISKATGLVNVEIMTDVTEAENNGKRIYTEQDKLDFLMTKNPELGHLKTRFNLDFDD